MIVDDRGLVMVVVRGDHRVNDIKLTNALGAPFRPAREDEFAERIGQAGYIGPVAIDVQILLDEFAGMGVGGYAALGRQAGDFGVFRGRHAWCVTDHEADPEGAVTEIGLQ